MAGQSSMVTLGSKAPDFSLPDTSGNTVSLADFRGKPLLVAFICNHCPYVKHMIAEFTAQTAKWTGQGLSTVAISANDASKYPEDGPEAMADLARQQGFSFPYLYDESQEVAADYGAVCTPDLFLYNADHTLVYRGRFDASRPKTDAPVTGADLGAAVDAVLSGTAMPQEQHPSVGCTIKWKPGKEPGLKTIV